MELTSENVQNTFNDCLYKKDEDTTGYIPAQGVMRSFGFHPTRLESHKEEIKQMLSCFSNDYMRNGGGGTSFLNMCEDKNGNQWTDLHQIMEQIVALGIACKYCSYPMPKEMWSVLPGGMPYVQINLS